MPSDFTLGKIEQLTTAPSDPVACPRSVAVEGLSASEQLADLLRVANAPIKIGLRAQGHLPTVRRMLEEGRGWEAIATEIGWAASAVQEWFPWEDKYDRMLAIIERSKAIAGEGCNGEHEMSCSDRDDPAPIDEWCAECCLSYFIGLMEQKPVQLAVVETFDPRRKRR